MIDAERAYTGDTHWLQRQTPTSRRQVTIGGRRIRVIDGHAHCVIPVQHITKGTPLEKMGGGAALLGPERLQIMDQQGVDVQALTINNFWWYAADADLARKILSRAERGAGEVGRGASGSVCRHGIGGAAASGAGRRTTAGWRQASGLRGASIGGHVNGEDLSLPKYDPFWAKAAELGVPVFMHPGGAKNIIKEGAFRGRGELGNIIGNPLETTYFLSRLIFDGTFDKFPGLRVVGAHAGGYLPSYLGRTEAACEFRGNAKCANKKKPSEYLKSQIVIDTMVFSDEGLRHLVAEAGVGQVIYGTDVPFNWPVTVDLVLNAKLLSDAEKEAILSTNLMKLLRIS